MSTSELEPGVIQFVSDPVQPASVAGQSLPDQGLPAVFLEAASSLMAQDESALDEMDHHGGDKAAGMDDPFANEQLVVEMLRTGLMNSLGSTPAMPPAMPQATAAGAVVPDHSILRLQQWGAPNGSLPELQALSAQRPGPRDSDYYFVSSPMQTAAPAASAIPAFDVEAIRRDFPVLHQKVHGKPLIWLDNAATTQKPQCVIDALSNFYERDNSNIHRAAHALAARATDAYEHAREKVARFLGAASPNEIVFTRGTTEAINLVAQTFGKSKVNHGDEILVTTLEHHANIVPWQMLAKERCAVLRVVPITDEGDVRLEDFDRLIGPKTKLVAVSHVSNVLGTVLPIAEIVKIAHSRGVPVVVDGAQAVAHAAVNVQQLGADFYVLSGHKLFAPTGVGVMYGREALLREMPPWQGGGNMIKHVTFEETTYSDPPAKFEAGTSVLAGAVGLGAAIDYVTRIGIDRISAYEEALTVYGMKLLSTIPGLRLIGTSCHKVGVFSFVLEGIPTEEVGRRLDLEGIAVRSGHHCAQPALARYGLQTSVRPSVAFYNTLGELDKLAEVLLTIAPAAK